MFHLRPGLTFSDGSPLTADDVVRSWRRIIDPAHPSPLVSLIGDVEGALAYAHGQSSRPGIGRPVGVRQRRHRPPDPAGDRLPGDRRLADVRRSSRPASTTPAASSPDAQFVGSGGYVLTVGRPDDDHADRQRPLLGRAAGHRRRSSSSTTSAGGAPSPRSRPAISTSRTSPRSTPPWLAYDPTPRPAAPAVRRALALVLRLRHVAPALRRRPGPPGVRPGGRLAAARVAVRRRPRAGRRRAWCRPASPAGATPTSCPAHDPDGARALLAEAGYPGGRGFPTTVLLGGGTEDRAFAAEIQRELGVTIDVEVQGDGFFDRLADDPPQIFSMGWVADYPGPNDFLGILLGTGASNNYGRWSSSAFDGAIAKALAAPDPAAARAAFDTAEGIVRDEAPVIPLSYGVDWSLARTGLLGRLSRTGSGSSGWRGWRGPGERRPAPGFRHRRGVRRGRAPLARVDAGRVPGRRRRPRQVRARQCQPRRSATASTSASRSRCPPASSAVEILVSSARRDRPDRPARRGPAEPATTTLRYHLDAADGGLVPNTPFTGQWRVVTADGTETLGPRDHPDLRRRPLRLEDAGRGRRPGPLGRGQPGVRRARPEDRRRRRRRRRRRCSA